MEKRKVDTYQDFRNGDFWDLWILGHIARTTDELVLVEKKRTFRTKYFLILSAVAPIV